MLMQRMKIARKLFSLFVKQFKSLRYFKEVGKTFLPLQENQIQPSCLQISITLYTPDKSQEKRKVEEVWKQEWGKKYKQSLSENRNSRCRENYFLSKSNPLEFRIKAQVRININKHLRSFKTTAWDDEKLQKKDLLLDLNGKFVVRI